MIWPDWQYPHCGTLKVVQARWTGWLPSGLRPSIVITRLFCSVRICVWHDLTAWPSTCTVQAPHSPAPQPNRVPVSRRSSRRYQSRGISGSPSNDWPVPFTVKLTMREVLAGGALCHDCKHRGLRGEAISPRQGNCWKSLLELSVCLAIVAACVAHGLTERRNRPTTMCRLNLRRGRHALPGDVSGRPVHATGSAVCWRPFSPERQCEPRCAKCAGKGRQTNENEIHV